MRSSQCGFFKIAILIVTIGLGFSQTYKIGTDKYLARIYPVGAAEHKTGDGLLPLMSDSVKRCYPDNNNMWTGTVARKGNDYQKTTGILRICSEPSGGSAWWYQGWFKFNLSAIPDSSTIDTVSIIFYCSSRSSQIPYAYVRLLPGDPVSANEQTLWTWITTGQQVTMGQSVVQGWQTRGLNIAGKAAVESCLTQDWIAFGLHEFTYRTGAWAEIAGHGSGEWTPYLEVAYTLPERTDISMEEILEPGVIVSAGTIVTPTGRWRNRQPHSENYTAWFIFINPAGQRTTLPAIQVLGQRGESDTVLYFSPFPLNDTGRWTVKCSTYAENDIDPNNDVKERYFRVVPQSGGGNFDVAVTEIISPLGVLDTSSWVTPIGRWRNLSNNPATFFGYFALINPDGIRVYTNSVLVNELPANSDTVIEFTPYNVGYQIGQWTAVCSTVAAVDTNPANNWRWVNFNVAAGGSLPKGWHEVKPMPLTPSSKAVKDGGWLTFDPNSGLIFAAKGNKSGDFYCYDPVADTWRELCLWREGVEGKGPAKGAVGVADGLGKVFAVKGNNTLGFWCYHIAGDSWQQLPDVPLGGGKKVKGGSDLVVVNEAGTEYIYLLKGYKNEFYRFNCDSDTWEELPVAPQAIHPKWDKGSWLVYDGNRYIYAHKAKYHEFWRFDLFTAAWDTNRLNGMPFLSRTGKNKKAKDGSSGACVNGAIFALKGGNTCEFYRYDIEADTWTELEPMPEVGSTGKKKRIKAGGDITVYNDHILYALKGNKTRELWYYYYVPQVSSLSGVLQTNSGSKASLSAEFFSIFPNPTIQGDVIVQLNSGINLPRAVKIYDNCGNLKLKFPIQSRVVRLNLGLLSPGIYWLRLDTGSGRPVCQKLVVTR